MNLILFDKAELIQSKPVSAFLPRRDERAEHLLKVLRKKAGDSFDAGVLEGKPGTGIITEITQEGLSCTLTLDTDPPPRSLLRLGVGFPRPIQLRRLLRDCASFGLMAVDLFGAELGEKSYRDTNLLHDGGARSAFIDGAVQARDTILPELAVYPNLASWLEIVSGAFLVAADNVRPQGSFSCLKPMEPGMTAVLAVGSERGWSDREREQLEQAGFLRLSLGSRALRTETACIAAIALVLEKMAVNLH